MNPRDRSQGVALGEAGDGEKRTSTRGTERKPTLPPHLARHLQRQPQLSLLILHGDLVSVVRAREAALRAETQVLQRHILRGGFDAALERVLRFECRDLGADQAEDDLLALGHEAERLEAAGA